MVCIGMCGSGLTPELSDGWNAAGFGRDGYNQQSLDVHGNPRPAPPPMYTPSTITMHIDASGSHVDLSGSHVDVSGSQVDMSGSQVDVSGSHVDVSGSNPPA